MMFYLQVTLTGCFCEFTMILTLTGSSNQLLRQFALTGHSDKHNLGVQIQCPFHITDTNFLLYFRLGYTCCQTLWWPYYRY